MTKFHRTATTVLWVGTLLVIALMMRDLTGQVHDAHDQAAAAQRHALASEKDQRVSNAAVTELAKQVRSLGAQPVIEPSPVATGGSDRCGRADRSGGSARRSWFARTRRTHRTSGSGRQHGPRGRHWPEGGARQGRQGWRGRCHRPHWSCRLPGVHHLHLGREPDHHLFGPGRRPRVRLRTVLTVL